MEICSDCGIFGGHKEHEIVAKNDLMNLNTDFIENAKNKISNIGSERDYKKYNTLEELIAFTVSSAINFNRKRLIDIYKVN